MIRKDLAGASATLALAFPDTYEIGMSHTGLKILYEIVNRRPEWACERAYAPWVDFEARMREKRIPALHGRVLFAGRRLRRGRVLAAGGDQLLQRPEHARPRGNPGRCRASAAKPIRSSSAAARAPRTPSRSRSSSTRS